MVLTPSLYRFYILLLPIQLIHHIYNFFKYLYLFYYSLTALSTNPSFPIDYVKIFRILKLYFRKTIQKFRNLILFRGNFQP